MNFHDISPTYLFWLIWYFSARRWFYALISKYREMVFYNSLDFHNESKNLTIIKNISRYFDFNA